MLFKRFKGKLKKENAWSKMAKINWFFVEERIKMYKNIRTSYVRYWKKRKPSGSRRESDNSETLQRCYNLLDTCVEHHKAFSYLPSSCHLLKKASPVATTSDGESNFKTWKMIHLYCRMISKKGMKTLILLKMCQI